ncbi:hypothetical protein VNO77_34257 [Canavalia gladiata]|uniref:Uncharacterized protein n=1 Tax=Canavalia gladiata TaxID=3824 RepID=A0AAN9KDY0_CANGL
MLTQVIMRNLVAHEALTKPDFLIFTRHTELMRAMIDTMEDVKGKSRMERGLFFGGANWRKRKQAELSGSIEIGLEFKHLELELERSDSKKPV